MSNVYFVDARARTYQESLMFKLKRLLTEGEFLDFIEPGDIVAIKLHVGERGHYRHIRPQFVRVIVDEVRKRGGKAFITDTSTLYRGFRSNAIDHIETSSLIKIIK